MKKFTLILTLLAGTFSLTAQSTSWTGNVDAAWTNTANWTLGVPSQTMDAVIGDLNFTGSNNPTIQTAAACRNLTIAAGRVLNVATSSEMLIAGTLTNNGQITSDSLHVSFTGNSLIDGSGLATYVNLKVASGATITLNKPVIITGDLVIDGTFSTSGNSVTFSGSTPANIRGSTELSLCNVVVNKAGSTLTLSTPLRITNSLTLTNGIVRSFPGNLLTLTDNAIASAGSATSYVSGPMKKIGNDAFVFPLGKNGVWARLGISAPSAVTDAFTAEYFDSAYTNTDSLSGSTPSLNNVSKVEYWDCERTSGSSSVNVELFWQDKSRSDINDYSDLVVAHWNGTQWENSGQLTVSGGSEGSVLSVLQNSFSPFTFGSGGGSNVLPITLVNFSALVNEQAQVDLSWQTEAEINNNYFSLERSTDGFDFTSILIVKGAGTSTVKKEYAALDPAPEPGVNYYRLKQVDHNGHVSYSSITSVEIRQASAEMEVYPNPVSGNAFSVALKEVPEGNLELAVYNNMGKRIHSESIANESLSPVIRVELGYTLAPGVYPVTITGENVSYRKKIVIR